MVWSLHSKMHPQSLTIVLAGNGSIANFIRFGFAREDAAWRSASARPSFRNNIELDPHDVDAAIGRWQALTGQKAVHAESAKTFDELAAAAPGAGDVE
jgi:hypothetical protein